MSHLWFRTAWLPERPPAGVDLPPLLLPPVDADRRWRGPYTAAGALVEFLARQVAGDHPDLVAAHDIELRTAAPDLQDVVPLRRQSVAARLPSAERILVHAPRRTLRISNGLVEFVRDCLRGPLRRTGPVAFVVENADQADSTDREFLEVLLRRIDPGLLTVVVCAAADPPAGPLTRVRPDPPPVERSDPWALSPAEHDRRADELCRQGRIAPLLGAVPYHREHGSDPARALEALRYAVEWCFEAGCHGAVAELGERALRLADHDADPELWWRLVHRTATAHAALGREERARELFDRVRQVSTDPAKHAAAAYSTAMLHVRHHDPARRDPQAALAWINQAVAISTLLPDRRLRAFKLGFDLNGKALVETRLGRVEAALRLVEEAIELAERELPPGAHPIHRLVLRANRAQLNVMLGRLEPALADLDAVIAADPQYPDYYLDRGNLLYRLGRWDEAVRDYETAMRVGPPFPEPYYNRAEIRFARGDHLGALADLDYALELEPDFVDGYVNRAGLLVALEEYGRARRDAEYGLGLDPGNPYLLCALGQVEMAEARHAQARQAFDQALQRDPELAVAWANRGMLAYDLGDLDGAIADLTRAIRVSEDATVLFNRAIALRAAGREQEAMADLVRARELAPDDEDIRRAIG